LLRGGTMSRRDYGTGSITKRDAGGWLLRWSEGMDPVTGQRVRRAKTFRGTKTEAQRELQRLTAVRRGDTRLTVGQLIDVVLPNLPIAETTMERYSYALAHLPKPTRELPASDVTPAIAGAVFKALSGTIGAQTLRKLRTALMACWRHARSAGWLDGNPWSGHRLPAVPVSSGRALTDAELRRLLAACDPGLEALWIRLSLITGARPGEILDAKWSALDGDTLKLWGSKTGKERQVVLDPDTLKMVHRWQVAQRERALAAGIPLAKDPYLVSKDPASVERWTKSYAGAFRWHRLRERAKLPKHFRLYDLRHTTVSTMQADGHDPATVAGLVGNNPAMTLRTYSHTDRERQRAAVKSMAARLG